MRAINLVMSCGALGGLTAVMLGAYGAHGLDAMSLSSQRAYNSAAQYQFYHSLALVLTSLAMHWRSCNWLLSAAFGFGAGLLLFCGSIYLRLLLGIEVPGWLTPTGGIAFMLGWGTLMVAAWINTKERVCRSS
ncbi:DUF423 domain-containing protein [Aestuariirhabdus sp. Z084]|uniref:DUF423 domain-containing protein n=1 Tax=Aestuariirhabdus haliotis TaxID=2918751 RepID=UPI00201B4380|nr:DUF423 domain-containing protein [Aestuariirhabdus haliotis]MCL6414165.1 DUF423 domain-containing protein [Aestuariirhabdus haliotis]MCL6418097.1 DUF423 domain-containing protein [Aestuariirhabdus haliotis]